MPHAKKRLIINIKSDPTIKRSVLALEYGDSTGEITAARDDLAEILEALRNGFPDVIVAVRTIQSELGG
jgi:hypothetical protein